MAEDIWRIPLESGGQIESELENGKQIFVVGANGSGKSALLQNCVFHLYQRYHDHAEDKFKWIMAHRRIWFESGSVSLTHDNRRSHGNQIRHNSASSEMRWKDDYQGQNIATVLFDVVARDHDRNRQVTNYCTGGDHTKTIEISPKKINELFGHSPVEQINELFKSGGFMTQLEYTDAHGFRARHENGGIFGVEQMSDGERNAMIMASQVITAPLGCVLLIDEPERHLHRAIIVPFLKALLKHREDCVFIISTHEVALPTANPDAEVIMLRSCQWDVQSCKSWDAVQLDSSTKLPEELKLAILGSREKILFVEGESKSLDCPLYTALFPNISVHPMGGCTQVSNAVRELRKTQDCHRIEAFGLVDRDKREDEEITQMEEDGIFALDVYSVEGLYFCSEVIEAVARQQAESLDGREIDQLIKVAEDEAFKVICSNENKLDERMARYRRDQRILLNLADGKPIEENKAKRDSISIHETYHEALEEYREAVNCRNLNGLVKKYPFKESRVFEVIAQGLECRDQDVYRSMVIALVKKDAELKACLKRKLGGLSEKLDAVDTAQSN